MYVEVQSKILGVPIDRLNGCLVSISASPYIYPGPTSSFKQHFRVVKHWPLNNFIWGYQWSLPIEYPRVAVVGCYQCTEKSKLLRPYEYAVNPSRTCVSEGIKILNRIQYSLRRFLSLNPLNNSILVYYHRIRIIFLLQKGAFLGIEYKYSL